MASWFVIAPERAKSPVKSTILWYVSGTTNESPMSKMDTISVMSDLDIVLFFT